MFEYHGQQYKKIGHAPPAWEAKKAAGNGGEFGGGLPQIDLNAGGKVHNLGQFGAIMRMFSIRFGYYNPKDWKCAMYHDTIVDTWADVLGKTSAILFGPPDKKDENVANFLAIAKKFNMIVESQLQRHGGKFVGGNNVGMGDFVMAAWIGNFIMNSANPCS